MQLSTDLEIAGLLTRISLNSEGLIYSTLLRITSDNLKVSNENFSTIYSNNILISTEILNTVIIFELIKTVVNLNLSNEDLELLLHPFGEKIYTQLHFSPFIDWDFDPNSIWVPLASNSSNQINISHLTSALTNYVTFEDIEGLIPSPSANINVINDWGLAVTSEDVLGATLGYYLKEEQIRIEDKIDNLFYFTNNTTTSRYPLNINGDLNVFNNIHATGGVSAGGIGDLFESGGVGVTDVVEEKIGSSNVVTGGRKNGSDVVLEMTLEVYSKDDADDLLATKVDKVAGYGLSQNNLTDALVQSINNSASAYTHSQITDGTNPHATTFANIANKPTTISGYGITDAYTKTYINDNFVPYVGALKDVNLGEYSLSLFNLNASNNIHAEGGVSAGGIGDLAETTSIIDLYRSWDDLYPTNKALEATLGVELYNSLAGLSSAAHTHSNKDVLDSTTAAFLYEEKIKLADIEANANKYILPYATSAVLGGVTVGSNIDINDGVISVKDASTLNKGVVQLSDSIDSSSSLIAATSKAVKAAWDLADSKWLWNENTIKGVVVNRSLVADKLTTPRSLWGQLFDGSSDVNGDLHSTGNISADGGVSAGGIGDLSVAITSGYNDILPYPNDMGNAVTSITSNGGSTLYYRREKSFSEVGHNHDTVYSLLGHIHDDRYYTEVEIGSILGGSTSITGYNKSNWDTAYTAVANVDACIGALSGQVLSLQAKNQYDELYAEYINARTISADLFVGALVGNASTATKLAATKTINGTAFDGSADITTLKWGTARTLTIGSKGYSVDGSGAVTWTLADIGAAAVNQTMYIGTTQVAINRPSGAIVLTGITSIDGNAATANKVNHILTRGSYLTGDNFDGSAAATWAVDADSANTPNKVVVRDADGDFAARVISGERVYGDTGVYAGGIGDLAESNSGGYNNVEYDDAQGVIVDYVSNVVSNTSSLRVYRNKLKTNLSQYIDDLGVNPVHTHSQYLLAALKGTANGLAELDSNGLVPASQLPSYVDDVLTYTSLSVFPATGIDGKIYIASNTNLTYRWSGTAYVEISKSLALGETISTAYRGDRGKAAYDHSQASHTFSIAGQDINALDGSISKASLLSALNVANGAQVNVLEGIKLNGTALTPDSKVVNVKACTSITVPTGLSAASLTSGGVITLSYASGYAIPTIQSITDINTNISNHDACIGALAGQMLSLQAKNHFEDFYAEYANIRTLSSDLFVGYLKGNADSASKLLNARTLWGQSFDGTANVSGALSGVTTLEATGALHTTNVIRGDGGVFSGGIGDLGEIGGGGYNDILPYPNESGNAVTYLEANGSTLYYHLGSFSLSTHNHNSVYSVLGHTHDDRYYTETEIGSILGGSTSITGYNKSNWDTAYGWGNHASVGYASQSALTTHANLTTTAHGLGASAFHADNYFALAGHNHSGVYQPLDADLTAIAGLTGTSGFLKKTAANTWSLDTNVYLTTHQTIYALTIQVNGATIDVYTPNSSSKTINISDVASASALSSLDAATDACFGALAGEVLSLQAKNQYDELYAEYANIRTLSSDLFIGYLKGNADTASAFSAAKSIALTGDITGSVSSTGGWSIATAIGAGRVTNAMLAGSIDNSKLVNYAVTISGQYVALGGSISRTALRTGLGLQGRAASMNGTTYYFASYDTYDATSFTAYAPTAAGTIGQLLISTGGTPSWVSQGAGGGIDADKLDNMHAVDFVNVANAQTITGTKTFSASVSMLNSLSVANNITAAGIIQGVGGVFAGGIADLQEDNWTTPALTNGMQGTTYGAVRYRLIGTNVQIDGSFTVTISDTNGLSIFQLPTGYRPVHKMSMLMHNNSAGIWRCVIGTDGQVWVNYIYKISDGSLITTATTCMFDKCIFPIN